MVAVNPYCACGHTTRQHDEGFANCMVEDCTCRVFNNKQNPVQEPDPDSPLVAHAKYELALAGNDKEFNDSIIEIVRNFSGQGHSGGSASVAIDIIQKLLKRQALTRLTDNPDEWEYHGAEKWDGKNGVWQNRRDGRAFSNDHGVHYWLVDDHQKRHIFSEQTPEGELAARARREAERNS